MRLRRSAYDGVTAAVTIPAELVSRSAPEVGDRPRERLLAAVAGATAVSPEVREPADDGATAVPAAATGQDGDDTKYTPVGLPWREKRPKRAVPRPRDLSDAERLPAEPQPYPNGREPREVSRMLAAYVDEAHRARGEAGRTDLSTTHGEGRAS
ncbi:hypothetical protein ACFQY4_22880 [Catellatospora bangladeshensis]|uniref:hypothetical protein n=1 Tax=Catellatospora bangladeshensis TaxID=310355 RepID=UPI00361B45AB